MKGTFLSSVAPKQIVFMEQAYDKIQQPIRKDL
jgi:hypothetical protein